MGSPMKGDDEGKGLNKRKFELKFSDIDKIDVNTENNYIHIGTFFLEELFAYNERI